MSEFTFIPTDAQIQDSNIYQFMKQYNIDSLAALTAKACNDPEWFWQAVERDAGIIWDVPYTRILDSTRGIMWSRWFVDGKTNIYCSSVEKFAKTNPDKTAYWFLSEDDTKTDITYGELDNEASRIATGLESLGIKKGDVVAIYLPMIREAIVTIMAVAKLGAVQTCIFSGYGSTALHQRLDDCGAKILITCDGFYRRGKSISQSDIILEGIKNTLVSRLVIVRYAQIDDYTRFANVTFYDELMSSSKRTSTTITSSEDPLFILYTSGTTGKPKGTVHVHGGFSVFAAHQSSYLIDMHRDDILFWPADIGWITGLVWNIYGLLMVGASAVIYDGALDYPTHSKIWDIAESYDVTILGVSPTLTRMLKRTNSKPKKHLNLRNIPTTGEPLDNDSWWWLFNNVGNRKIPIMNLSGGTEIGGAMLSVLPGLPLKPSTVGVPVPGMNVDVVDDNCRSITGQNGFLVIRSTWPAMTRSLLNDDKRFLETYWSRFDDVWFHGDYVHVDEDGLWYMQGRADDIINVSGHRLSTAEIESAILTHLHISDAAAIAVPDDITGQAIVVFYVVDEQDITSDDVSLYITQMLGKIARPRDVYQLTDLPKTRTGKVMRRLIRAKLLNQDLGDLSSIENPKVLDEIQG